MFKSTTVLNFLTSTDIPLGNLIEFSDSKSSLFAFMCHIERLDLALTMIPLEFLFIPPSRVVKLKGWA